MIANGLQSGTCHDPACAASSSQPNKSALRRAGVCHAHDLRLPHQGNVDLSSEYEMREQIGKGAFGAAFLVLHKETRKQYVLKRVRLAKQTNWQRNSTLQERDMVRR
jgi:serine/threonine protein kinase